MSESVEIHPLKVRRVAIPVAVFLFGLFTVGGIFLRATPTGVDFRVSDQIAMVAVGALMAGGVMLITRPRLRANADGVEVRNIISTKSFPWSMVRSITFPDGAIWARLELPEDEYVPILAIQASDGQDAVKAMRDLRHLRREIVPAEEIEARAN